jgi:nitroimidazol reductase NimA-like FMN-containing flavoprotein (pyridoxamine 5'-phosphate oxidase superfamily)
MTHVTHLNSILSQQECWDLLADVPLGRIVTSAEGRIEIFPVNFAVHRRGVLVRTAEGTKLVSAVMNEHVLFEADQYTEAEGWSVVVKGEARILRSEDDVEAAQRTGLLSWTTPEKEHWIWIRPISVTGRRFLFQHDAVTT